MSRLTDIAQEESEILAVFKRAETEKIGIQAVALRTGNRGGKMFIINAKPDYALVRVNQDEFDSSVKKIDCAIHVYGSSILYI